MTNKHNRVALIGAPVLCLVAGVANAIRQSKHLRLVFIRESRGSSLSVWTTLRGILSRFSAKLLDKYDSSLNTMTRLVTQQLSVPVFAKRNFLFLSAHSKTNKCKFFSSHIYWKILCGKCKTCVYFTLWYWLYVGSEKTLDIVFRVRCLSSTSVRSVTFCAHCLHGNRLFSANIERSVGVMSAEHNQHSLDSTPGLSISGLTSCLNILNAFDFFRSDSISLFGRIYCWRPIYVLKRHWIYYKMQNQLKFVRIRRTVRSPHCSSLSASSVFDLLMRR